MFINHYFTVKWNSVSRFLLCGLFRLKGRNEVVPLLRALNKSFPSRRLCHNTNFVSLSAFAENHGHTRGDPCHFDPRPVGGINCGRNLLSTFTWERKIPRLSPRNDIKTQSRKRESSFRKDWIPDFSGMTEKDNMVFRYPAIYCREVNWQYKTFKSSAIYMKTIQNYGLMFLV